MTTPPTQDQWDEAFSQPHDLDPSSECWGLYAYSDAPPPVCGSGLGRFHWFHTEAELVFFIRDYLAWWNPAPSSMEPKKIAAEVQAIVDAESGDVPTMVDRLNEVMKNMWHIEWCGQFRGLCQGPDEFPLEVRGSFFDDDKGGLIPLEMTGDFKNFLQVYGL